MNHKQPILVLFISLVLSVNVFSKTTVSINFDKLSIAKFIKITSKILNRNILVPSEIKGNIDFIANGKVYEEDLLNILTTILESKGYSIIDDGYIIKIIKKNDTDILEKKSIIQENVEVLHLKNAEALSIVKIVRGVINQKKYNNLNTKPFVSIDQDSNSIILMGQKKELNYLISLIKKLDSDRQQVYVQAKIIEISENLTKEVGIKYGINGFNSGGSGLAVFSSSLNGGTAMDLSSLSDYGFNLTSMKEGLSLGMSLNLLNQNGAADIVSEPSLLCINNKESSIYVGQTISIKTGTTSTSSGIPTDTYSREDIGLTLKIKPRISNEDKVLLKINTKLEDVGQTVLINSNPNTSKKELLTSAIVNNGESIILGGYIRSKKERLNENVPFLSDIPLLGNLFRNTKEVNDKINLVIIITPYIVPKNKDLSYVRNQLLKLKLLEDKYTKDVIVKLETKSLKDQSNTLINNEKKTNKENNKISQVIKDNELTESERLHQERLREIFNL